MHKVFVFISLVIFQMNISGQSIVTYKNSGLYGLKNLETQNIVLPAKYNGIHGFNDSLVIVTNNLKEMALVNLRGEILIDYRRTLLLFNENKVGNCPYDSINDLRLAECPYTNPEGRSNMHLFYINPGDQCHPTNYNPCPAWKNQVTDSIEENLKLIQLGEQYRWLNDIDSAILFCKMAIDIDPNNPANYYWGAKLLVNNTQEGINSKNNFQFQNHFDWIETCLHKAESLEDRYWYKLQILRLKKDFYKNSLKDKVNYKIAKDQIKALKVRCL